MKIKLLIIALFINIGLIAQNEKDSIFTDIGYIIFSEWGNGFEGDYANYYLPFKNVYMVDALKENVKNVSFHLYKNKKFVNYDPIVYNIYLNNGFRFGTLYYDLCCCEKIKYSNAINDSIKEQNYKDARMKIVITSSSYELFKESVYKSEESRYKIQFGKAKITYCLCDIENNFFKSNVTYGYIKECEKLEMNQEDIRKLKLFFDEVFKVQKKVNRTRWKKLPNKESSYELIEYL
jgi:hypothetical protein